jgi:hypothetical protein
MFIAVVKKAGGEAYIKKELEQIIIIIIIIILCLH